MKKTSLIVCILVLFTAYSSAQKKKCSLNGKVIDRPHSKAVLLTKAFEVCQSSKAIRIPIENSSFTYELEYEHNEAYMLVFEEECEMGRMQPTYFFLDEGEVKIELHSMNKADSNLIIGGNNNIEYSKYKNKWDSIRDARLGMLFKEQKELFISKNAYTDTMKTIFSLVDSAKNYEEKNKLYDQMEELRKAGLDRTDYTKKIQEKIRLGSIELYEDQVENLSEQTTIAGYFNLIYFFQLHKQGQKGVDIDVLRNLQQKFAVRFKEHPYTTYSNIIVWKLDNLKVGEGFYDFSLSDFNGKEQTLSKLVKNKYAVINFWAPWCGPCHGKSKQLIEVYEKFKDKGFTVIGVVSKYRDIENVKSLLEKDKHPWVTLIDDPLENNLINDYYGLENAGGSLFLIDNTGKIAAISPSVGKVEKILEEKLK